MNNRQLSTLFGVVAGMILQLLLSCSVVLAFTIPSHPYADRTITTFYRRPIATCFHLSMRYVPLTSTTMTQLFMAKDGDDMLSDGMAEAFRELEALNSLGNDDSPDEETLEIQNQKRDGFEKIMKDLEQEPLFDSPPEPPLEEQVKLYKEMFQELEKDKDSLYSDVLTDMGGTVRPVPTEPELILTDPVSSPRTAEDLEIFMNQALQEALAEARLKTPEELAASAEGILDDKEMMKEIEQVFEKANQELLASLDVIRAEQAELAKKSAERTAQDRMNVSSENAERLEQAQGSMAKMLDRVSAETAQVERAVRDLQAAQVEMEADPLMKLSNLKQGGLVKQGALVGALLFTFRSIAETVAMVGPDGESHAVAALIQGAIALACAAYFFIA